MNEHNDKKESLYNRIGNAVVYGFGFAAIGFLGLATGNSVVRYFDDTKEDVYTHFHVKAGLNVSGSAFVSLEPKEANIATNAYIIGACDVDGDGFFEADELVDLRGHGLDEKLNRDYYEPIFQQYYDADSLSKMYREVAPRRLRNKIFELE